MMRKWKQQALGLQAGACTASTYQPCSAHALHAMCMTGRLNAGADPTCPSVFHIMHCCLRSSRSVHRMMNLQGKPRVDEGAAQLAKAAGAWHHGCLAFQLVCTCAS